jgi:hypothetical protein
VLRRMTVAWAAAEVKPSSAAGPTNALVQELVERTERFRHRYFSEGPNDRAGALGSFLRGNAPDLAEALHQDEEFAGLMDRAFGDWLVLPTVYDMLEYRIPDQVGPIASAALHRLRECGRLQANTDWLEVALSRSIGLTVRELLAFLHLGGSGQVEAHKG